MISFRITVYYTKILCAVLIIFYFLVILQNYLITLDSSSSSKEVHKNVDIIEDKKHLLNKTQQNENNSYKKVQKTYKFPLKNYIMMCIHLLYSHLRSLNSLPKNNEKLLNQILNENSPYLPEQETCAKICENMPILNDGLQELYKLKGNFSTTEQLPTDINYVTKLNHPYVIGGGWTFKNSSNCDLSPKNGVAIVLVIRDRWTQLASVLSTLVPLLRRQKLCYRIFVIEQAGNHLFNRGMLFNVGFMEAIKYFHFDCVVFHDADLAPINDLNPYGCDLHTFQLPIHLGVGLDERDFKLNYPRLIGGVLKMKNQHFVKVNGHSNLYWGWGQEDDDLEKRLTKEKIGYYQMHPSIARYRAVPHVKQNKYGNPRKLHLELLAHAKDRMSFEGLTSLKYNVIAIQKKELFTHILVDLGTPPDAYLCANEL